MTNAEYYKEIIRTIQNNDVYGFGVENKPLGKPTGCTNINCYACLFSENDGLECDKKRIAEWLVEECPYEEKNEEEKSGEQFIDVSTGLNEDELYAVALYITLTFKNNVPESLRNAKLVLDALEKIKHSGTINIGG